VERPITVSEPDNPHALIFRTMAACIWEKVAGAGAERPRASSSNRRTSSMIAQAAPRILVSECISNRSDSWLIETTGEDWSGLA
jgi:hypothetical protein